MGPKRNLDHTVHVYRSSALVCFKMSSSKLFLFSNRAHLSSGVRLLLELYCVVVIKHLEFFNLLYVQNYQ